MGSTSLGIVLFKGMEGKFDIINAILSRGSGTISAFVEEVREIAKEGYEGKYLAASAEIEANLILSGKVEGVCSWEKKIGTSVTVNGEIKGRIGLSLEAKIEGKTRVFELKARAGAELKTTAAKDSNSAPAIVATLKAKAGKKNSIDFDGDVLCTGLAIYYGFYAEVVRKKNVETEEENDSSGFPGQDNTPVKSVAKGTKLEKSGNLVLVDEFSIAEAFFGKEHKG